MTKNITWVGMDAHKKAINVAAFQPEQAKPQEWIVENQPAAIRRLVKKLVREAAGSEVRCCYEAGPCGYALPRQIEAAGPVICEVIAPGQDLFPSGLVIVERLRQGICPGGLACLENGFVNPPNLPGVGEAGFFKISEGGKSHQARETFA